MKKNIFYIILILAVIITGLAMHSIKQTGYISDGDCFDEHENKIKGSVCDVQHYPIIDNYGILGELAIAIPAGIFISATIILLVLIINYIAIKSLNWRLTE